MRERNKCKITPGKTTTPFAIRVCGFQVVKVFAESHVAGGGVRENSGKEFVI